MPTRSPHKYELGVFINCPFDQAYLKLFRAIIFAVHDCGFVARSAQETDNSGQIRLSKIYGIISECQFGIHDLSRTKPDKNSGLPRFNMPLELGIFLGARQYGPSKQGQKSCLILDKEKYRYQQFCSDIAGQDIRAHAGQPDQVIAAVRSFLGSVRPGVIIPGASKINRRYVAFLKELPAACRKLDLKIGEMGFYEYTTIAADWLAIHP